MKSAAFGGTNIERMIRLLKNICVINIVWGMIGRVNPDCTLEQVCVSGYTRTIRPPAALTNALKVKQIARLKLNPQDPRAYEEDHIIPLELCGDPGFEKMNGVWVETQGDNLIPERWDKAKIKDQMENHFHKLVCQGKMPLEKAQTLVVTYE